MENCHHVFLFHYGSLQQRKLNFCKRMVHRSVNRLLVVNKNCVLSQ